jgi:excisionase family DNA binding protein
MLRGSQLVRPDFVAIVCQHHAGPIQDGVTMSRSERRITAQRTTARQGGGTDRRALASAEELSAYLGVPLATLYAWNHRRQGPTAHKVGRHLRYRWVEVETWLDIQAIDRAA